MPSTVHEYYSDLNHFGTVFGVTAISTITVNDIDEWCEKLNSEPSRHPGRPVSLLELKTFIQPRLGSSTGLHTRLVSYRVASNRSLRSRRVMYLRDG